MGRYAIVTDIVFVRQDVKNRPRSTMALDRRWFFQVTADLNRLQLTNQQAFEHAGSAFLFFNTVVFRVFFLHFCRMPLSFFFFRNLWQDWQR